MRSIHEKMVGWSWRMLVSDRLWVLEVEMC